MKTLNKILLISAVGLIPLGVFAYDKHDDKYEKGDRNKQQYDMKKYDDDKDDIKYYESKGVNYEFEGRLESKPKTGFNGVWMISGMKVTVNDKTFISHDKKGFEKGDKIEVLGKRENGKIIAIELEQD